MKRVKLSIAIILTLIIFSISANLLINRPVKITGDELEKIMNERAWNSASLWWLDSTDSKGYKLRYDYHPLKSDKFFLDRAEISFPAYMELKNLPVQIHSGDITLRANRYPGAVEKKLIITTVGPSAKLAR